MFSVIIPTFNIFGCRPYQQLLSSGALLFGLRKCIQRVKEHTDAFTWTRLKRRCVYVCVTVSELDACLAPSAVLALSAAYSWESSESHAGRSFDIGALARCAPNARWLLIAKPEAAIRRVVKRPLGSFDGR